MFQISCWNLVLKCYSLVTIAEYRTIKENYICAPHLADSQAFIRTVRLKTLDSRRLDTLSPDKAANISLGQR